MYSFPNLEPVHFSMCGSNSHFLTCIQVLQEAGKVVWYSYLSKNFPQFIVTHIVFVIHKSEGFSTVYDAEVDAFLEFSCIFYDLTDAGNLNSGSSDSSKSSLNIWDFSVHILFKPSLENLSITLLSCEMSAIVH